MRLLVASTRGAGHLGPLVPFVEASLRRGDEVLVAGPEDPEDVAGRAGYPFWRVADPPPDELEAVWSRVLRLPFDEANEVVIGQILGRLNTAASLPRLVEACEGWEPDVVLRDPAMYGAALAAELTGVPHARVAIGLAATEGQALAIAARPVDALRREAGLPPDPDLATLRESPYLSCFPASLEDPDVPEQPHTRRFCDPAWDAPPAPLPQWWEDTDAPLVYVTFGSVAGALTMAAGVYRTAVEAVEGLPARVLLTVGHGFDPGALPPAPDNLHVERWVPQTDVLAEAAAVVCHGGSGSTLGALAAGVPLVVVPLFADQPANARRVEATGAGLVVEPPDAGAVHHALRAVLGDAAFAAAARELACELRSYPPADAAAEALAGLLTDP